MGSNIQQHAVVVGGSSGIGFATARVLARLGLRVTIASRDTQRMNSALSQLDGNVEMTTLDAGDAASVRAAFERIGALDHLVSCVPSNKGLGPLKDADGAAISAGFSEKAVAQLVCAQAALPTLRRDGSITFVSAVTGHMAMPGTAGIAAVNAAISAAVPVLAAELKPLRVNAVAPGVIDTPWWDFLPAEQRRAAFADFAGRTPVGRVGRAEDVAEAIAFLVGNTFIDGQVLVCDGGLRLAG